MPKFVENTILFLFGGVTYSLIEILFRGFTHWSMTITGGICLVILFRIFISNTKLNIFQKCLIGSIVITALEFTAGCIVNIILDWNVWDYSDRFMNLWGQICLPFTIMWFLLTIPVAYLCKGINNEFTKHLHKSESKYFELAKNAISNAHQDAV